MHAIYILKHASVILYTYITQTLTASAKMAAAFTSLSPDGWASDVNP